jgi:hypothetical protein
MFHSSSDSCGSSVALIALAVQIWEGMRFHSSLNACCSCLLLCTGCCTHFWPSIRVCIAAALQTSWCFCFAHQMAQNLRSYAWFLCALLLQCRPADVSAVHTRRPQPATTCMCMCVRYCCRADQPVYLLCTPDGHEGQSTLPPHIMPAAHPGVCIVSCLHDVLQQFARCHACCTPRRMHHKQPPQHAAANH